MVGATSSEKTWQVAGALTTEQSSEPRQVDDESLLRTALIVAALCVKSRDLAATDRDRCVRSDVRASSSVGQCAAVVAAFAVVVGGRLTSAARRHLASVGTDSEQFYSNRLVKQSASNIFKILFKQQTLLNCFKQYFTI